MAAPFFPSLPSRRAALMAMAVGVAAMAALLVTAPGWWFRLAGPAGGSGVELARPGSPDEPWRMSPPTGGEMTGVAATTITVVPALATTATRPAAPAACARQQLEIALGVDAPQRACVDATRVLQNGGVRSYVAGGAGTAGWTVQVDLAGGQLLAATLRAGDGRRFGCAAAACQGIALGRHGTRGVRSVSFEGLRLVAERSTEAATVSGRLEVPVDDLLPGLACIGASVLLGSPDGSAQRFCGQGGAGVEIADDGMRHYRFEDAEGQTLTVSVNEEQRVVRVTYGALACRDGGCVGASMVAPSPQSELSERSFFFGRTPLLAAGQHAGRPGLVLDGSLVLPAQE